MYMMCVHCEEMDSTYQRETGRQRGKVPGWEKGPEGGGG